MCSAWVCGARAPNSASFARIAGVLCASPDHTAATRILGAQANLWTEFMYFGRQVEYMAFPRLCALAEVFWSPREKRDFASFERRLAVHGARLDLLGVNRYRGPLREVDK